MMQRKVEEIETLVQGVSSEDAQGQLEVLTKVQDVIDNVIPILTLQAQLAEAQEVIKELRERNKELEELGNETIVTEQP